MEYRQFWMMSLAAAFGAALLAVGPRAGHALDVDPGDYAAAPPSTNLAIGYGLFGWNNSFKTRTGDNVPNSHLDSQFGILRLVHYTDIAGITADPQIFIPFGFLNNGKLDGEHLDAASGLGDIIIASTFWPINEPENKRWLGITPFMFFPTGSYRNKQVLNIGENRYKGVLQLGFVQGFGDKWIVDVIGDTTFYGDNPNGGASGRSSVSQDNSYQFQTWLRYYITPEWAVGPGYSGTWGGTVEVGGDKSALSTEIQQLRLITQYFPLPDLQVSAQARTDVRTEGGYKQTVGLIFRVMKVF